MNQEKKFLSNVGEFIKKDKCKEWRNNYAEIHQKREQSNFVNSHFFGKENIQILLDNPDAVGIRIYYGVDIDEKGTENKKLILFPVDENGNDIYIKPLKDNSIEATTNDVAFKSIDDEEAGGLDGGWPCPPYCTTKRS